MQDTSHDLEDAVWAAADATAAPEQLALLEADRNRWLDVLEDLLEETEDRLEAVRRLNGGERAQVVADFEAELAKLEAAYDLLSKTDDPVAAIAAADPAGEVRLQASWSHGEIVVWAAGPGTVPATSAELSDRLEAIGGPAVGWSQHPSVVLPGGARAAALAIPVGEALGWLVAVGAGLGREGVGASVAWLGRVAVAAVRQVANGAVVPTLPGAKRTDSKNLDLSVTWVPALVDEATVSAMAAAMPGPVTVLAHADPRAVTLDVIGSVVDTILRQAAAMANLAAPPPATRTTAAVAEAFVTRLDGSSFEAPVAVGAEVSKRIDRWSKPVTGTARVRLVVQLDPPDKGDAWFLSVLGPGAEGTLLPIEVALADGKSTKPLADELLRIERIYEPLLRPGAMRRGQVYLSQEEAWELMTARGPALEAAGFDVRVPALSRKKPSPSLKLFTEPTGESVVGAHQLSNVRWSVLFDDVELTAADIARLAAEAKPLVRSHGKWVELDAVDLKEAAAALAERADKTRLTGAEILRHSVGLEGTHLAGALTVDGEGWATDLLQKAQDIPTEPITRPEGFVGELRSYQAEALAWLRFLHTVELGGCLALDMGLGKTPTMLAHLARTAGEGPAIVIAPPAVVGNWAAEAARFTPGLKVMVHHGANRASGAELEHKFDRHDLVITTYGTAVRDVEILSARQWDRLVLDEAQAIKNSTSETAQQLRRIPARTRVALTGTPIENGLGDLWSILDFTNPGLVGPRPAFIAQMQGEGEAALRALNGILVFRRTKSEPEVAAELPDRIDELDHCMMTPEQIGLYQAVLDGLVTDSSQVGGDPKQGAILAAITALKQICNHPTAYQADDRPLAGRSGKLTRLEEIVDSVFSSGEKILIFTHFAEWGKKLADHLTEVTGQPISCYHGGLARGARDRMIAEFQASEGAGALVLSLKAGGTGLNLTAASHVVLYDRWWNPAVEDQATDRAYRIGQTRTVNVHKLVTAGTLEDRIATMLEDKRALADSVVGSGEAWLAELGDDELRALVNLSTEDVED
ncbi:MAG: Helicase, family [Acidimicrobiales bacterium]|nr:Helicase, family [Acidimicrobiales bacterium]